MARLAQAHLAPNPRRCAGQLGLPSRRARCGASGQWGTMLCRMGRLSVGRQKLTLKSLCPMWTPSHDHGLRQTGSVHSPQGGPTEIAVGHLLGGPRRPLLLGASRGLASETPPKLSSAGPSAAEMRAGVGPAYVLPPVPSAPPLPSDEAVVLS